MSELMDIAVFQKVLPKGCRNALTDSMVNNINNVMGDVGLSQNYRDNLISYTSVMNDGKYKIQSYIDAVRYVSFKLLGSSNVDAYTKTFPDRYSRLIANSTSAKDITSYVSAYNKTKLVQGVFAQTLTPSHVLNADLYQKAINVQASLMVDSDVSPKVRSDAANSLLLHLKAPEAAKIELDINIKQDKTIDALRASTMDLVKQQRSMLEGGNLNAREVAHSNILIEDGEVVD